VPKKGQVLFSLYDINGKLLKSFSNYIENNSVNNYYLLSTSGLLKGKYLLMMKMNERPLKTATFVK
jgi:hypothetical protein